MPEIRGRIPTSRLSFLSPASFSSKSSGERAVVATGTTGKKALPYFLKQFQIANDEQKVRRALSLWKIERNPGRVIGLFLKELDDKRSTQRSYAFIGLTSMGKHAQVAVPKLTRLLNSERPTVVCQSLKALAAIQTKSKATREAIQKIADSHTDAKIVATAKETLLQLPE